jgi:hypothetical protein
MKCKGQGKKDYVVVIKKMMVLNEYKTRTLSQKKALCL